MSNIPRSLVFSCQYHCNCGCGELPSPFLPANTIHPAPFLTESKVQPSRHTIQDDDRISTALNLICTLVCGTSSMFRGKRCPRSLCFVTRITTSLSTITRASSENLLPFHSFSFLLFVSTCFSKIILVLPVPVCMFCFFFLQNPTSESFAPECA